MSERDRKRMIVQAGSVATVEFGRDATVEAGGYATVEAGGHATVEAGGHAIVEAGGQGWSADLLADCPWARKRSDGYVVAVVGGWVHAGCRHFRVADARAHWSAPDYRDRALGDETLAILDSLTGAGA